MITWMLSTTPHITNFISVRATLATPWMAQRVHECSATGACDHSSEGPALFDHGHAASRNSELRELCLLSSHDLSFMLQVIALSKSRHSSVLSVLNVHRGIFQGTDLSPPPSLCIFLFCCSLLLSLLAHCCSLLLIAHLLTVYLTLSPSLPLSLLACLHDVWGSPSLPLFLSLSLARVLLGFRGLGFGGLGVLGFRDV